MKFHNTKKYFLVMMWAFLASRFLFSSLVLLSIDLLSGSFSLRTIGEKLIVFYYAFVMSILLFWVIDVPHIIRASVKDVKELRDPANIKAISLACGTVILGIFVNGLMLFLFAKFLQNFFPAAL